MKITSKKQTSLNDECVLIKTSYESNENDYDTPKEIEEREVFCGFFSINENEYYEAAKEGIRLNCGVIINSIDNISPDRVRIENETYEVERRYQRQDGYTELYLKEV